MPPNEPHDLKGLGQRLKRARQGEIAGQSASDGARGSASFGFAQAMQVAVEMVASLAMGGLLGWFLDRWLGTTPALLILFIVLGMAAGVRSAYRAAQRYAKRLEQDQENGDKG
ncbi:MAG: AtpZ/AtpI family protein [Alphaproteobacteria bacterium]|nr:AtpZ/AtpI family protein [Alphaproteobacteria bacterium]